MSYRQGKQQRRQPTLATETAKTEDDSMETASTETPHIESTLHLKEVDRAHLHVRGCRAQFSAIFPGAQRSRNGEILVATLSLVFPIRQGHLHGSGGMVLGDPRSHCKAHRRTMSLRRHSRRFLRSRRQCYSVCIDVRTRYSTR